MNISPISSFVCLVGLHYSIHNTKGAATFQKLWVSIFPSSPYKRPTTAVKGVEWGLGRIGEGFPFPSQPTISATPRVNRLDENANNHGV